MQATYNPSRSLTGSNLDSVSESLGNGDLRMDNLLGDRAREAGYEDLPSLNLDRYDPCEIDPPAPLEIFTRIGVLLMIALAFGLAAELLVWLPH
jgi:hypothetical protein